MGLHKRKKIVVYRATFTSKCGRRRGLAGVGQSWAARLSGRSRAELATIRSTAQALLRTAMEGGCRTAVAHVAVECVGM